MGQTSRNSRCREATSRVAHKIRRTEVEDEIWETCPGFEDYEVSSFGRVCRLTPARGTRPGRMLRARPRPDGHRCVGPVSPDGQKTVKVARLVCRAFHGRPRRYRGVNGRILLQEARHLDGDATNDRASNLAWGTCQQSRRAAKLGAGKSYGTRGTLHHSAKLTEADVIAIRADPRTQGEIAREYRVGQSRVWSIKSRRSWAWLD